MMKRPQIRIKSEDVDKAMYLFTYNPRPWNSYPADRIEVVLKHFNNIPASYMYSTFDVATEELIFLGPPELEVPSFADSITIIEHDHYIGKERIERKILPPPKFGELPPHPKP